MFPKIRFWNFRLLYTLFIGGITSSTPKPFGTKETNSFFPPKSNDDKDDDGEAMEVDENGKIVKNAEKDDKEQPVEGQDLSQLFEEKDPKVTPTENVIAPTKDVADKNKEGKLETEKPETKVSKLPSEPTKTVVPQSPQKSKSKEKPKEIQLDFNIDKPEGRIFFIFSYKVIFFCRKSPRKEK